MTLSPQKTQRTNSPQPSTLRLSTDVDAAIADLAADLRRLLDDADDSLWAAGETIIELRNTYKISYRQLEKLIDCPKYKKAWLQRLAMMAEHYPKAKRIASRTWHKHYERYQLDSRRPEKSRPTVDEVKYAVDSGANTQREITAAIAHRRCEKLSKQLKRKESKRPLKAISNKIFNAKWESVVKKIPNKTISVCFADPPFGRSGSYFNQDRKKTRATALRYECDNANPEDAIATTLPLFNHINKYEDHGVIILLQDGGKAIDPRILKAADEGGWKEIGLIHAIRIYKDADGNPLDVVCWPSGCTMNKPIGPVETEIVVFCKKEYEIERLGTADNRNVIFWRSPSREAPLKVATGKEPTEETHNFEFPPSTTADLISRFIPTHSNQIVFEPFACTAPACVASIHSGWRYVAAESDANNYSHAQKRIRRAKAAKKKCE